MSDRHGPGIPADDAADERATAIVPGFFVDHPRVDTVGDEPVPPRGRQADTDETVEVAATRSEPAGAADATAATVTIPKPGGDNPKPDLFDDTAIVPPRHQDGPPPSAAVNQVAHSPLADGVLASPQTPAARVGTLTVDRAEPRSPSQPGADSVVTRVTNWVARLRPNTLIPGRTPRLLLLFGGSIFLLAYIIAVLAAGSGLPRGTTVLGIDIGGLATSAAIEKLETELPARLADEMTLVAGEDRTAITPSDAGLSIDYAATVSAAGRSSLNPFTLFGQLRGAEPVDPVVVVDDETMSKTLDALAQELAQDPREGAIAFADGAAEVTEPRTGRELNKAATGRALERAYGAGRRSLDAPVTLTEPEIGPAEVQRALTELAEPALSGPITLDVSGEHVEVPVRTFADALSMKAEDGRLLLTVDGKKLHANLRDALDGIEVEPRDASFEIAGGRPQIEPSRDGKGVPPDELAAAVLVVLPDQRDRVAEVELAVVKPELTTEQAEDLGVVEKVSSWTTTFDYAEYRAHNIGQAARYLDGALVLPNEEFSFNDRVGERTGERGFVRGIVISGGTLDEDWGGGVSAVVTTTFNAVFYAGLKDIEHHPHSFWISRYPKGTEATVAWGAKDLRFLNDSGNGIYIQAAATNTSVTVTFWGTERYDITRIEGPEYNVKPYDTLEKDRCVPQSGMRGFDIEVWRVFNQDGREVKREKFTTHYIPADKIICEEVIRP